MEEYLLLMRLDIITKDAQPSPEQLQGYMKLYQEWVGSIAAQDKFVGGKGLSTEGRVVAGDELVTDGPFVETKESLAGFITIKAKDFDEAVSFAKKCPILGSKGNTVEVRKVVTTRNEL